MRAVAALAVGLGGVMIGVLLDRLITSTLATVQAEDDATGWALAPDRRRPAVAAACGALFAAATLRLGGDWALPAYLVLFAALVVIAVVDLDRFIVPNRVVYPAGIAMGVVFVGAAIAGHDSGDLRSAVAGAVACWVVLLAIHLASPAAMGFGDVRLGFVLGLGLGWLHFGLVFVGVLIGCILGVAAGAMLMGLGVIKRDQSLPFGPFLAAGGVMAVLAGDPFLRLARVLTRLTTLRPAETAQPGFPSGGRSTKSLQRAEAALAAHPLRAGRAPCRRETAPP